MTDPAPLDALAPTLLEWVRETAQTKAFKRKRRKAIKIIRSIEPQPDIWDDEIIDLIVALRVKKRREALISSLLGLAAVNLRD